MSLEPIELRFSRVFSGVFLIIFAGMAYVLLDVLFIGRLAVEPPGADDMWLVWVFFILFSLVVLNCLKQLVLPNLIFAADYSGVRIGSGVVFSRVREVPWRSVLAISEGRVRYSKQKGVGSTYRPAVKLKFDNSVDLGRSGYSTAYPSSRTEYVIAEKHFSTSLAETIEILAEMKR